MQPFHLTLKNYRCFSDVQPLEVELREGITALVGPNNSGKSTLLRFFYEVREVLTSLTSPEHMKTWLGGHSIVLNTLGVDDAAEIFHNGNDRDLEVNIRFETTSDLEIREVKLKLSRAEPLRWRVEYRDGQHFKLAAITDFEKEIFVREVGSPRAASLKRLRAFHAMVADSLYIGPYRSAIGQSSGSYFDLAIGSSFVDLWNQWKTGITRAQNQAALDVTREVARILGFRSLEINAMGQRGLQIILDGKVYGLRELGTGVSQFIVVFGNVLVRQPKLILIDEPEVHLHPSLQIDFLLSLAERSRADVIMATHSLGLARAVSSPIYSFRREANHSKVQRYEQTTDFPEFLGEMSFGSFQELGCKKILLVEGVNEVKSVQSLLRLIGLDHQVVVLPMGGDQFFSANREQELAELLRLSDQIAVIIDSERAKAGDDIPEPRRSFLARCQRLGFQTFATERRAFENYLTTDAVRTAFGPEYQALTPYQPLRALTRPWSKSDNWRAIRAMKLGEIEATDLGQFLVTLE